jgi:GNAT superfamily N-acetyltransferase
VRCNIIGRQIVGFYSIIYLDEVKQFGLIQMDEGYWLDHMFILPEYHNKGIGREFFKDINKLIISGKIKNLLWIFVDPYAKGFYEKMGAKQIRLSKSSILNRDIPVFQYKLNG